MDRQQWEALDGVFTPDATGGVRGDLATVKAFLAKARRHFTASQHLVATSKIELAGTVT